MANQSPRIRSIAYCEAMGKNQQPKQPKTAKAAKVKPEPQPPKRRISGKKSSPDPKQLIEVQVRPEPVPSQQATGAPSGILKFAVPQKPPKEVESKPKPTETEDMDLEHQRDRLDSDQSLQAHPCGSSTMSMQENVLCADDFQQNQHSPRSFVTSRGGIPMAQPDPAWMVQTPDRSGQADGKSPATATSVTVPFEVASPAPVPVAMPVDPANKTDEGASDSSALLALTKENLSMLGSAVPVEVAVARALTSTQPQPTPTTPPRDGRSRSPVRSAEALGE